MLNRYNIALIPESASQKVIDLASTFLPIRYKYFVDVASRPHVTIYQFNAEVREIDEIIERIKSSGILKSIKLCFKTFSCISFDGVVYWISLMPDRIYELTAMHEEVANILGKSVKEKFDPHMTLMDTKDKAYQSIVDGLSKAYSPIIDRFILSIGVSDEVGQYKKELHRFDVPD